MKIIQSALLVAVIGVTVAFPTPQEDKPASKTAKDEEHIPTVQKIEIHVEVKAMSPDVKMPATVTVSEGQEPLVVSPKDKSHESKKSDESVQMAKASETSKLPETAELHKVKKIQVVVQPTTAEESKPKKSIVKADDENSPEEVGHLKSLPIAEPSSPSDAVKMTEKPKSTLEQKPATIDALSTTSESKIEDTQAKSAEPSQDTATSEPRPVVIEAPMSKSNEQKPQDLEEKKEITKNVKADKNQQAKDDDDSKEDNSSEESPKSSSSDVILEDAVKETMIEIIKEDKTAEMQANDAPKDTVVPVVTEGMKQAAKSVEDETVIPIVEDLPNKKQSVEAEPTYRMIPVTVVIEKPKVKEISVRTVVPAEKKEEEKPPAKAIEPESGAEKIVENEAPKEPTVIVEAVKSAVTVMEPEKVDISAPAAPEAESVKLEEEIPSTKSRDPITVETAAQEPAVTELQKDGAPAVRAVDPIKEEVEPVTVGLNVAEAAPKVVEEPVSVVEPVSTVDTVEVVQQDAVDSKASVEPATETELNPVEPMKEEGSSTKAAAPETEIPEKKVEDTSISSSATTKALEDVTSTSKVAEKVEEAAAEEAEISTTTTTTTTTTTPAPVKTEGKKGKKKLPANIRGYSKRLQQEKRSQ